MEIKKWTILDTEYLIRRPWLTARRDRVALPDGRIHPEYYVLEYPTWVNIIAIRPDGRYVMVRQYRHGLGEIGTELCAGVVEEGEQPEQAARRELSEETGYAGGEWKLNCILSANPATSNNLTYCYIATGVTLMSEPHLDSTEDIEVCVLDRDQVLAMLREDRMKQALMAASLWKHFYTESDTPPTK